MCIQKRSGKCKGLGLTDIVVILVVVSIITVVIYNMYKSKTARQDSLAVSSLLNKNADTALDTIVKDFLYSSVFASGCRGIGLIRPRYGGMTSPDEVRILTGQPFSTQILIEDMEDINSPLAVEFGSPFRLNQKIAICDDANIAWFEISQMGHKEQKGLILLTPKLIEGRSPFDQTFAANSYIGAFAWIEYKIKNGKSEKPYLIKIENGVDETIISNFIENIKFEYYLEGSEIPVVEPFDLQAINAVKISVVSRSPKPVLEGLESLHSLTGELDRYLRLRKTAKVIFSPISPSISKDLEFRIIKDKNTGDNIPLITKREEKSNDENE